MSKPLTVAVLLKLVDQMTGPMKAATAGSGKSLDDLGQKAEATGRRITTSANLGATAVKALVSAFSAYKLAGLVRESTLLSARFETMGVVMGVAGNNAGYTRAEMATLEKQMQTTGISMIKSREVLTSLATASIDLAKATGLARAAQDLAVVGNLNSSDALARMVQGIKSGEVEILKTLGLNVSFEASYKKLAASLGVNTTALTELQKVQARTDAVMAAAAAYAGIYAESMSTASKQIQSMTRYVEDAKVKFGETFNEALTVAVFGLSDALKAANGQLDEMAAKKELEDWGSAVAEMLVTLVAEADNLVTVVRMMTITLSAGAAQLMALNDLNPARARAIGAAWRADMDELAMGYDRVSRAAEKFNAEKSKAQTNYRGFNGSKEAIDMIREQDEAIALMNGRAAAADESAAAAVASAAAKARADAVKAAAAAYSNAVKASQNYIAQIQKETATIGMSGAQQAMYNAEQIAATMKLAGVREKAIIAFLNQSAQEISAREKATATLAENIAAQQNLADQVDRLNERLNAKADAESDAQVAANALIQGYTDETAVLGLSNEQRELAIAMRALEATGIRQAGDELAGYTQRLREAVQDNQYAKAAADVAAYLDPAKAQSFGDALAGAFGKAGGALGALSSAFEAYAQKQAEFNKEQAKVKPGDFATQAKMRAKQAEIQIGAYASMATAAKGFFKENSKGYKAMEGVEKTLQAMQLANMATKLATQLGFVSAKVAGDATSAASGIAADTAQLPAAMALNTTRAIGAVANQGNGDPYTAFPRIAAMIAIMAGIGLMVGGGGGGSSISTSAQRQKTQGTGTVLGDPDAKSNSLANALEMLADVNTLTMQYSARMAKSLQAIEVALTGVSSMIFRTPGLTSGNLSGTPEMSKVGTLGFSSKNVSVTDSGLFYKGALSGIEEGLRAFTEVTTQKSSWWGLKKKTSTSTVMRDADGEISKQFGMIFKNVSDSLVAAGGVLGQSADILETQIANTQIDLSMVSLKGLKGDDLEDALNAVISSASDKVASAVLPGLDEFQRVGEGYYETAIRVAYSTEAVQASLGMLDNAFTGTHTEIVEMSQALIGLFGDLEAMIDATAGYYDAFYSEEEKLADTTAALAAGFANINRAMPETKAEFRAMVEALDMTSAAGREVFVTLMDMAPAFAEVADAAASIATDAVDAAMDALSRAVGAERDAITAAYDQQSDEIRASIDLVGGSVSKLKSLSAALASTLNGMRPQEYAAQYRAQAQAQVGAALMIARAGGPLPTAESLQGALSTLTQDARGQFATRTDYLRDQLRTAAELRELSWIANDALSVDERQLSTLQDQLDLLQRTYDGEMLRLDGILDNAQAQVDALNGIDTSVMSVEAAIVALGAAINAAKSGSAVAAASSAASYVNSPVVNGSHAGIGDSGYRLEGNTLYFPGGGSHTVAGSAGAQLLLDTYGLASGGLNGTLVRTRAAGGYTPPGWTVVGEEGPELVDFGSPSRVYTAADTRGMMGGNNTALLTEIKALREEVVLLRAETRATVSNTGKTAALLDRAMPDGDALATRVTA